MAEDNNRDAGKMSRKDAKREARIEAKRRKLAEQRANKTAQEGIIPPMSTGAAGNEPERSVPEPDVSRPVTADTQNTERRVLVEKYEAGKEPDEQLHIPDPFEPGEEPAGAASAKQQSQEQNTTATAAAPKSRPGSAIPGKIWSVIKSFFKWLFRKIGNGLKNMTPALAARLLIALLALTGIIYGVLQWAEHEDNKTDVFITDEGFHHAEKFDACVPLIGIDVSEHQKGEIDWKKLKSSGVDYVFLRTGYRAADDGSLHADDTFHKNYKAARKAGLMVGAYFFSQALTPEEGKEEANFVLDIIKDVDLTMPVAIDYEIYKGGRLDKKIQAGELYAASLYHDIVLGFTERLEKKGYETVVYASRDMLTNYMQADILDDMANVWLARYDSVANLDADYWFWQCSDNGKAGGIEGSVDKNFWYMQPEKVYETRAKHSKRAISVRDCRISFKRSVTRLRNFRAVPKFDMTYEGKGMKKGRDYVYSIVKNTQPGTGYVIIRGIGKYKDWIMYPFKIE